MFLNIDMRLGYHHVCMNEEDIYKIGFCTRCGHYEFLVVPFGPTNAPTIFMCLMNNVFHPYLDKFVIVYVDDILIYSHNEEEHVEHLATLMILLRDHQLYAKINKCHFFQSQIQYLGHVISQEGIKMDLERIKSIMEWPTTTNVDEVKYFMVLVVYYKEFIWKF